MALRKHLASNPLTRSVVSFRPPVASSSRLFNTKSFQQDKPKGEHIIEVDGYEEIFRDLVNTVFYSIVDAFVPRPSSTKDLARTLNDLDHRIGVKSGPYPRWDVMEDAKALYLRRDMSGLGKKDVKEYVGFPSGENCFFDYRIDVFGFKRLYRVIRYPQATFIINHKEKEADDDDSIPNSVTTTITVIDLPGRLYKTLDIKREVDNHVLMVTIPKERGNKICRIRHTRSILMFTPQEQEEMRMQEIFRIFYRFSSLRF